MMTEVVRQTPSPIQTQNLSMDSPPLSANSSPSSISKKRSRSPLSIDLTSLPPLSQPTPPSNTLLITRLDDAKIFHPASLATIRQHLNSIATLNSFSPLKSMSRIICSFYDTDSAIKVRQAIDGTAILGNAVAKCYFGEPTPIGDAKKFLDRPDAGRLFFISPPPSPPVGWEMRHEDPPNKEVHADDLAAKLEKLSGKLDIQANDISPKADEKSSGGQFTAEELQKLKASRAHNLAGVNEDTSPTDSTPRKRRSRSSTLIYDPKAHGDSPVLPVVMLETEDDNEEANDHSDIDQNVNPPKIIAHTARPPVELIE